MTGQTGKSATLVVGGARSGKSRFAERLAEKSNLQKIYIATGSAMDAEMAERIGLHQQQRGSSWTTIEERHDLAGVVGKESSRTRVLLIDCLTLWLANLIFADLDVAAETGRLVETLAQRAGPCLFVSNEVGMSIVPENRLSRSFRDAQGRLNQDMAKACDQVVFVASGLPLLLKPNHQPDITL